MKTTVLTAHFDSDCGIIHGKPRCHPWWMYANLLSLDAPIVAVVWLGAFSSAFESPVALPVYVVLFISVWSIYVTDRLIDGLRQKNWELATQRHRFVRHHQKRFIGLLILIMPLAAVVTLKALSFDLIIAGLILCAVVVLYFTAFVRLFPHLKPMRAKEFACGFVFAIGTTLGVDAIRHELLMHPAKVMPVILLFSALCIFNCLIIAAREHLTDQANDPVSASNWWTHLNRDLIVLGVMLTGASCVGCLLSDLPYLFPACFISAFALTLVHLFQSRFSKSASRVLVDAVLLSPLLLI